MQAQANSGQQLAVGAQEPQHPQDPGSQYQHGNNTPPARQHQHSGSMCSEVSTWTKGTGNGELPWSPSHAAAAAAAAIAAFGDCRPADFMDSLCFAATDGSEYYDMQSRGSSGEPTRELSFAATASPASTDGGTDGSAAAAAVRHGSTAIQAAAGTAIDLHAAAGSKATSSPASAGKQAECAGSGGHGKGGHQQGKKGRAFRCCFVPTTASPAGSGAGAPVDMRAGPVPPGMSRLGGKTQLQGVAVGLQCPSYAEAVPTGQHDHLPSDSAVAEGSSCQHGSCMADDSFCSAESVAATSWSGSYAGTETDTALSVGSCPVAASQQFPLQPMPPPPLWASPLFPPPEGYLPVGVEEEDLSDHPHFAQRVKMLRLQAAAAAAGSQGAVAGREPQRACAGSESGMQESVAGGVDEQHLMQHGLAQHSMTEINDYSSISNALQFKQQQGFPQLGQEDEQEDGEQVDKLAADWGKEASRLQAQLENNQKWAARSFSESPKGDCIKAFFQVS